MTMQYFQLFFISIGAFMMCYSDILKYHCNFDTGLIDDCIFNATTGARSLSIRTGRVPTNSTPDAPLSDVKSIMSLTAPKNESCQFPYNYPLGNWIMYFCQYHNTINYTCPTTSGTGQCVTDGQYGFTTATFNAINDSHFTNITTMSNTVHCLDFYYYLTNTLYNAKISAGWTADNTTETIVQVTAQNENKWQQTRMTFISPSSEIYPLWFRMTRDGDTGDIRPFTFALDEIKIFEDACEYASTVATTDVTTTETASTDDSTVSSEVNNTMTIEPSSTINTSFDTSTSTSYDRTFSTSTSITTTINELTLEITTETSTLPSHESQLTTIENVNLTSAITTTADNTETETTSAIITTTDNTETTSAITTTTDSTETTSVTSTMIGSTRTEPTSIATTTSNIVVTTTERSDTTPDNSKGTDLKLILGLSLGLNILNIMGLIINFIFCYRFRKQRQRRFFRY